MMSVAPKSAAVWTLEDQRLRVVPIAADPLFAIRMTKRMAKVDARLLAIARGEAEPEAAPSSAVELRAVVPPPLPIATKPERRQVVEETTLDEEDYVEVRDSWLDRDAEPEPFSVHPPTAPRWW
jgi:hypothetical protein